MTVVGIGMDLVEIGRMERALERRPGLAGRLFTDRELLEASDRRRPARHLAARFAAKEAVLKAIPVDAPVALCDIEVVGSTPPGIEFRGGLADLARAGGWSTTVSLTHEREMAGAVAVVEVPER
jgi:holo-[acyl-carrier protein] synthase